MKFSDSRFEGLEYRVWSLGGNEGQKARRIEAQRCVQMCKSACGLCKGGMREYRVRSMEYRQRHYCGWRVTCTGDESSGAGAQVPAAEG